MRGKSFLDELSGAFHPRFVGKTPSELPLLWSPKTLTRVLQWALLSEIASGSKLPKAKNKYFCFY